MCKISSKSLEPRPRYGVFGFFKMVAAAVLDFQNFEFFHGRTRHECRTASPCQISSKSFKPGPRCEFQYYASLAWKCLFTPLWKAHFPQMMLLIALTPKSTILGLNHVIWAINREYRSRGFSWALEREKKGQDRAGKSHKRVIFHVFAEKPPLKRCTWKICFGDVLDVITCAKFQNEIFRGYDFTGGRIFHFHCMW